MSDYLTRLQARRAALNAQAVAAPAAALPWVCPRCEGEASLPLESGEWFASMRRCPCPVSPVRITDVIAELDRAIVWARQATGVEETR